jgi:hypothetical protein
MERNTIFNFSVLCGVGAVLLVTAIAGTVHAQQSFVGPCGTPTSNNSCSLFVGSSTRAVGFGTSTIYSTMGLMTFKTLGGSNQHIVFSPNGNVGIATSSPSEKLSVNGNVKATAFIGAFSGSLSAANVTSDVFGRLQGNGNFAFPASLGVATSSQSGLPATLSVYGTSYHSDYAYFGPITGSPGVTISPSTHGTEGMLGWINFLGQPSYNNVVLGHDNDSNNLKTSYGGLEVGGDITTAGRYYASGSTWLDWTYGGKRYTIEAGSGYMGLYRQTDAGWVWRVSSTSLLLNENNGNVGIGTANPQYALHVVGDINYTGNLRQNGSIIGASLWSANGVHIYNANYANWDANVGIGTTTPRTRLYIAGPNENFTQITQDDMYDYTELTQRSWGGSHGLLWGAYKATGTAVVNGTLLETGNTKNARDVGSYSYGAGSIVYYANGGTMLFSIASTSAGVGTNVVWGTPILTLYRPAGGYGGLASFSGAVNAASLNAPLSAGNVTSGVFGSLQGNGNFAFPASLGVATSSQSGLPQALSVYGNAYISGSIDVNGIGGGNHIPNSSIELGTVGSTPFSWHLDGVCIKSAERARTGSYSVKCVGDGTRRFSYPDKVWIDPNQPSIFTAWYQDTSLNGLTFSVAAYDASNNFVAYYNLGTPATSTATMWQLHKMMKPAGYFASNVAYIYIWIDFLNSPYTGTIWLDDLQFEQGTANTEWKPNLANRSFTTVDTAGTAGTYYFQDSVGIGTSTPAALLHVAGTGWFKDDNQTGAEQTVLKLGNFADTRTSFQHSLRTTDAGDQSLTFFANRWMGVWAWKRGGSTGEKYAAYLYSIDNAASYFNLYDANNGNTLKLHGGGSSFFNGGNVGIGTTTPGYALTVVGSMYSPMVMKGSSGSSLTIDWSAGNEQHVVLTASTVTLTFTNPKPGARYTLILRQDSSGSRTVSWPGTVRWPSGTAVTLTSTANKTDYVGFMYNGYDGTYDNIAFNANF